MSYEANRILGSLLTEVITLYPYAEVLSRNASIFHRPF